MKPARPGFEYDEASHQFIPVNPAPEPTPAAPADEE
jgi:hypothetical protein